MSSVESIDELVISYPKLHAFIAENPSKLSEVLSIIDEIKGEFSHDVAKWSINLIDRTLVKLYHQIPFEYEQGFDPIQLKKKYHLILVPNHQSHADYIALNYVWYKYFASAVHIAGGINLNIFLLGKFFRNMGAFFIRRSFQNNPTYKLTFEAYIYYLLKTHKPIEFFFEGGRSRTGKLLPPKYGLFQMILEAHSYLTQKHPLMFLPISIAHEHIPEENAHARELEGGMKKKESIWQLAKLLKLIGRDLGNINIRIGEGIVVPQVGEDLRQESFDLAFKCFIAVGEGMPVSGPSLLAMILLDEPSGAQTWDSVVSKSRYVIDYCHRFAVPLSKDLRGDHWEAELRRSLDMLISNNKVYILDKPKLGKRFYTIKKEFRVQVLYLKNMIIHHFIVPSIMNSVWINMFNGTIKDIVQLHDYLESKRGELKFEFYLPSAKKMLRDAMNIISYALGRQIDGLDECLHLNTHEMFLLAVKLRPFSTIMSFIYESYYIAASTIKFFNEKAFTLDEFLSISKEIHDMELVHGKTVKYQESYLVPVLKDSLKYFLHVGLLKQVENHYMLTSASHLDLATARFAQDVSDQVVFNLRLSASK
jgi:glycerol-3-phosphate O-acyltransferase